MTFELCMSLTSRIPSGGKLCTCVAIMNVFVSNQKVLHKCDKLRATPVEKWWVWVKKKKKWKKKTGFINYSAAAGHFVLKLCERERVAAWYKFIPTGSCAEEFRAQPTFAPCDWDFHTVSLRSRSAAVQQPLHSSSPGQPDVELTCSRSAMTFYWL